MKTFAIGDIHGRLDLMNKALAMIEQEETALVVFLGDYIDRGPDSKGVIERLRAGPTKDGHQWVPLMGNHEAMMVEVHKKPAHMSWWLGNGGDAARKSWGGKVPSEVLEWAGKLPVSFETEHHYLVHAGINPEYALKDQHPEEIIWIREKFLRHTDGFEKHVVHGHTPHVFDSYERVDRTNLDAGAYISGILHMAEIDLTKREDSVRVMEVRL